MNLLSEGGVRVAGFVTEHLGSGAIKVVEGLANQAGITTLKKATPAAIIGAVVGFVGDASWQVWRNHRSEDDGKFSWGETIWASFFTSFVSGVIGLLHQA